jgi:tetratricopeptide (TPR) repeat protein
MFRSFLDTRETQDHLTRKPSRSKSLLEHLALPYLIATLLAFNFSTPMVISAQMHDKEQNRSDAEALAEAGRLNKEVVRLYQAGRAKEALPLAKRALAIREKVLGPEHPDTALSLNNLGGLLDAMGDQKGAKPYYERALAIREKVLGPDPPDTAGSFNNMGGLLQAMGDLKGAKPYWERALAITEKVLGPERPDTAQSVNNMGFCTRDELIELCDYKLLLNTKVDDKVKTCPLVGDTKAGVLIDKISNRDVENRRAYLLKVFNSLSQGKMLAKPFDFYLYGHTHKAMVGQDTIVDRNQSWDLKILNTGAFQRVATREQIEEIKGRWKKENLSLTDRDILTTLQPEDLPACYTYVRINPYKDVPEPALLNWVKKEGGWGESEKCSWK